MKEPFLVKGGDVIRVTPNEVVGTRDLIQVCFSNCPDFS